VTFSVPHYFVYLSVASAVTKLLAYHFISCTVVTIFTDSRPNFRLMRIRSARHTKDRHKHGSDLMILG